jgi:hypothetical protein
VRACFPWLALLVAVGLLPAPAARGQGQEVEASIETEQPPANERPGPSPAVPIPASSGETPKPVAGPAVEASQLDTFLLRDSKGNLVPVLGLPFEEFEELLRVKKGLAPPPAPGYVLEKLSLVGTAEQGIANLQLTATIKVRDEQWVRVPLNLPTAVVREPARHEGPGEHFLTYDAAAGGYICWLKGSDPRPHVVTVAFSVGLTSIGDERRLAVTLPRATESSLRLTAQDRQAEASLIAGEGILRTRTLGDDRTEVSVLGPAGDLQLSWHPGRDVTAKGPSQLDASGEIAVRIESEHRITSDARLRVRSYGAPLETFRVRLPPAMELVPLPPTGGYSVRALASESSSPPAARGVPPTQMVEVRLDKPTTVATEILLRAQREADALSSAPLMPARFDVLGAVRQRGTIDFTMDGEWQLDWTEDKSVHRLDLTPDTAASRVVARFEFFRQPCGLALKVAARPSRVSVEPTHMVYVDPQRVRIETTLKYRFRGARAAGMTFEVGDWSFDRISPDALLEAPVAIAPGKMQFPFRAGAAPPTELELKLETHRTLPANSERLALTFPRPVADVVAPATIVIAAADNVDLTPQISELVGLSSDTAPLRLPGRQQAAVVYRDLGGGEPALFAAEIRKLTRTTTTSARASVRVDRQQAHIDQRLSYRVAHEPQRSFVLAVPRELALGGNLQVRFNDEPLVANPVQKPASMDPALTNFQFTMPVDQIGPFEVSVRYTAALRWDGQKPTSLTIPMVLPVDSGEDQFTGQQVEFTLVEGLQIEPDIEGVDELARPTAVGDDSTHVYAWSAPVSLSRWTVAPSLAADTASITVSQMWVQTWLTPEVRQERACFRMSGPQETVRVKLPQGVRTASVQTAIDGQEVRSKPRDPWVVVVTVPEAMRGRPCVLEVWYALDPPAPWLWLVSHQLRGAEIVDATPPRRMFWQLVVPENQYQLLSPGDMAAEMAWPPDRFMLARRPVMDQRQLETWIKASRQEPLPRGMNEYLYGTLGRWPTLRVISAPRLLVVSLASGALLAAGLLLLHVPRLRSPGLLLAAAALLAAGALVAPDFALLAAQAAVLGVIVTAAAAAWSLYPSAPIVRSALSPSGIAAHPRETPSTQPQVPRTERSSRITATAPANAPIMEVRP